MENVGSLEIINKPMNIPALASDIAQRVPEMHRDSTINNANLIENLLNESMAKQKYDYDALLATIQLAQGAERIAQAEDRANG